MLGLTDVVLSDEYLDRDEESERERLINEEAEAVAYVPPRAWYCEIYWYCCKTLDSKGTQDCSIQGDHESTKLFGGSMPEDKARKAMCEYTRQDARKSKSKYCPEGVEIDVNSNCMCRSL